MLSTTKIQPFGRYTDIHASNQKLKTQEKAGCANCHLKIPQINRQKPCTCIWGRRAVDLYGAPHWRSTCWHQRIQKISMCEYKTMTRWWLQVFFMFTPILGEDFQFDRIFFWRGWFNHQLLKCWLCWFFPNPQNFAGILSSNRVKQNHNISKSDGCFNLSDLINVLCQLFCCLVPLEHFSGLDVNLASPRAMYPPTWFKALLRVY